MKSALRGRHERLFQQPDNTGSGAEGKVLAEGQILLIAYKRQSSRTDKYSYLIKVNDDGTLDSSFADGAGYQWLTFAGSHTRSNYKISVDSRERSLVASESEDGTYSLVARLSADGRLDPEFGGSGILRISSPAGVMRHPLINIDGNDKAVISAQFISQEPFSTRFYLFRLENDGSPDPTFNNGDPIEFHPERGMSVSASDRIDTDELQRIIFRAFGRNANEPSILVARFNSQGIDTSFGEDGYFILGGFGIAGGLTVRTQMPVVVSDDRDLWKLLDE